jgi:hypothetical protein
MSMGNKSEILSKMLETELVSSRAFSIYVGKKNRNGVVTFGGIDKNKFGGAMGKRPVVVNPHHPSWDKQ